MSTTQPDPGQPPAGDDQSWVLGALETALDGPAVDGGGTQMQPAPTPSPAPPGMPQVGAPTPPSTPASPTQPPAPQAASAQPAAPAADPWGTATPAQPPQAAPATPATPAADPWSTAAPAPAWGRATPAAPPGQAPPAALAHTATPQNQAQDWAATTPVAQAQAVQAPAGSPPPPDQVIASAPDDPRAAMKERAYQLLFDRMGARLYDSALSNEELNDFVMSELDVVIAAEDPSLSADQRHQISAEIADDVLGHGPAEQFLRDETVTEIMINGTKSIYIEQNGKLMRSPINFSSDAHLRQVIERIVARVGRRIDESSPMVDARLPDGSRVNAIIPPLAVDGSVLTIRKFKADPLTVQDLINFRSFSPEVAQLLEATVLGRLNILVSGGTGTGKTTLLNVLSSFIPEGERIVTIEDSCELQLRQDHVIRLESRPPNIEGKGAVPIRDLVKNALRMRPDRIIVGECRSGETLDMLQAMNTGHDGSLSTLHANTPRDALSRVETMVMMAGMDLPIKAIREQVASAVDLIVQVTRMKDGTRRVTKISEIDGMEGEIITLTDLFEFDYAAGMDENGKFRGEVQPTGIRPKFVERLADEGITLPPTVFGAKMTGAGAPNTKPGGW